MVLPIKKFIAISYFYLVFTTCTERVYAENDANLSFQGYSGLFNVPNAMTTEHGTLSTGYSNLIAIDNKNLSNNNVITSIGILPFVEIGGRIAWFDTQSNCYIENCELRDLSANIKIRVPLSSDEKFNIAIGQQDIGGKTNTFSTQYLVASKSFERLDISAGWGKHRSNEASGIDGLFTGLEYKPTTWLHVIAEYDTNSTNIGLRFKTPENTLPFASRLHADILAFQLNEQSNEDHNPVYFSLSLDIPLSRKKHPPSYKEYNNEINKEQIKEQEKEINQNNPINHEAVLKSVFVEVKKEGFDRVNVGYLGNDTITIAFENSVYSRNDLDALNKVKSIVSKNSENNFRKAKIILKKEGLSVYEVNLILEQNTTKDGSSASNTIFDSSEFYKNDHDITWVHENKDLNYLKPTIIISPELSSAVATEFGLFDYSFGLDTSAKISLWPGALITLKYIKALDQSSDFNEGGVFYQNRLHSEINNYGFQQTFKILPTIYTSTFFGITDYNYKSMINETTLFNQNGQHKISVLSGYYEDVYQSNISFDSHVIQYRYFFPFYDISTTFSSGKFFEQDTGYRLDFKFLFDDNAISFFYKNTNKEFIGMGISIPLTPRKSMETPVFRLKGDNQWSYMLQTQTGESRNRVDFGNATFPLLPVPNDSLLFNDDRLNTNYLRSRIYEY